MAIPDVSVTERDPGLGIVPASSGKAQVKIGVCTKGVPGTVYSFGSVKAAVDALGAGPLVEAVVQALDVAGGPVIALPVGFVYTSFGAAPGALTLTGSGTGTVTASRGPAEVVTVKIILGGAVGVATFQVKVGSGGYGPTTLTASNLLVPGQYTTNLAFAAGTYVADDTYTLNLNGTVTRVGTGTATLLDLSTSSPIDSYELWVKIATAGALGVGAFQYSLDGGSNFSAPIQIPTGGVYSIAGTGLVLTFAGTFVAADLYVKTVAGAAYTSGEATTALDALIASSASFGCIHLLGKASNAANAAALAAIMDTKLGTLGSAFRYAWGAIECAHTESDADIKTAFLNFTSSRVAVFVGDVGQLSPLNTRTMRRCCAWPITARLGKIKLSEDPGQVNMGGLKGVSSIYRDERATPGLDEARFTTVRTFPDIPGYFCTQFRMMAAPGSDYTWGTNRRVMDRISQVARQGYVLQLLQAVRIDLETGYIDERDAQISDAVVSAKLRAAVIDEDEASSVQAQLSRTDNLLSTSTANAEVSAVPKGYFRAINVTVGFVNPRLQLAGAAA